MSFIIANTRWVLIVASSLAMTGCGALHNTAYRSESTDNLKTIAVDAKQRFVFIKTEPNGTKSIVCPEPSPDALSAGSISLSVDASKDQLAELKAALASAEQATSIGLRTQSISLLRDQLAYMCLLRMADAREELDPDAYLLLFKRYQAAVLGVLAIEQLTGAVRVPAVQVSATGNATVVVGENKKAAEAATDGKDSSEGVGPPQPMASAPKASDEKVERVGKQDSPKSADTAGDAVNAAVAKAPAASTTVKGAAAKAADQKATGAAQDASSKSIAEGKVNVGTGASEAARNVVASGGSTSDMAVVAQTVFNIVELIVTKSFQFENCYAANSRESVASTVENSCPVQQRLGECLVKYSRDVCEEALRQYEANSLEKAGKAENTNVARAEASVALQRSANVSIPADIPLEAMRFGVFRCAGTSEKYPQQMRALLISKGVPDRRVAIRDVSDAELVTKGFDVSVGAQVLFDPGVASELKASPQFVNYAQQVIDQLKGTGKAIASPNKKDSTPLYMSVMFCQR